jgi:predicted metal-dependent hydrolase
VVSARPDPENPTPMTPLPPYTVRPSARARRVSLRITPAGELEVVVPQGFDTRRVPAIVRDKAEWVARQLARAAERRAAWHAQPPLPREIPLRAVGERWRVAYVAAAGRRLALTERPDGHLVLRGAVDDAAACRRLLRRWLAARARGHLPPWLERLAAEHGLSYGRVALRAQRTRWGSCSSRGTISLNVALLFLPEDLVRAVLLHELCHTEEMNHSPAFWRRLAALDPAWREAREALRTAWRLVPRWVQEETGATG